MRSHYQRVRRETEALAAPLSAEDQTVQSMPDASPTKWHRAHTTWFFETFVLQPNAPGYRVFDPAFGYVFNSYYEAVGPRHPRRSAARSAGPASTRSPPIAAMSMPRWTACSTTARPRSPTSPSWACTTSSSIRN